jgi:hypothetical protein
MANPDPHASLATAMDNLTIAHSANTATPVSQGPALPTVSVDGKDYEITRSWVNKKGKTSWIWKYGLKLTHARNGKLWMCEPCYNKGEIITYSTKSTTHQATHLEDRHELFENEDSESQSLFHVPPPFTFEGFKKRFLKWVTMKRIAFDQVEDECFTDLILYLNPTLESHLPSSGNTIRNWIMDEYRARKEEVRAAFHASKGLVHYSFDMWTSSASMAMIAIVAHHISKTGEAKDCLLGLRQVESDHSGANMAEVIAPVIREYGLEDRVGYFVLDNIKSNDTCVQALTAKLQLNRDPKQYRLRCFGHIVNLAARAFISGKVNVNTAEDEPSFEQLELEESEPEVADMAVVKKLLSIFEKVLSVVRLSKS